MAKGAARILAAAVLEQRSELYRWLLKHHAEFAPLINSQKRKPWNALSKTAAAEGLTFKPDTLRKAWGTLQSDLTQTIQRPVAAKPATSVRPPVQPSPPIETTPTTQQPGTDPSDDIRSRLAKGRQVPKPIF